MNHYFLTSDKKAESPVQSEPGEELPLAVETEPDAEVAGDAENKDSGQSEKTTEPAESTPRQQEQEEVNMTVMY